MKKRFKISVVMLFFANVFLTGCSSSHNVAVFDGGKLPTPKKRISGVDVELSVDKQVLKGSATCTKLLFFTVDAPEDIAYGYTLQTSAGIKGGDCIGGSVYNAVVGHADYLIAPKYDVRSKEVLCIFGSCLYSTFKVDVSGFPGRIENIKSNNNLDSLGVGEPADAENKKTGIFSILPFVGE